MVIMYIIFCELCASFYFRVWTFKRNDTIFLRLLILVSSVYYKYTSYSYLTLDDFNTILIIYTFFFFRNDFDPLGSKENDRFRKSAGETRETRKVYSEGNKMKKKVLNLARVEGKRPRDFRRVKSTRMRVN